MSDSVRPHRRHPPGSPVPGILQARTLEWVAISFSNAWKWKVKGKSLSHVRLFVIPWTAAYQAPQSMGFARQEYWSGCHLILLSTTTINLAKDLYYDMSPFLWLVYISKFAELPLIFSCIVPPLSFFKLLHKTCFYLNWCQYLNCYKIMCFYTINTLVPGFLCWLFQLLR